MATGTSTTVSTPAFHADDPEQTTEYRTLSVLAIISLVFGVAAPLALAAPLLLAIPLFGIAVSIIALRRIATSGGVLAGRWAAISGLVLCVACGVAPFSRDLVLRSIRTRQAEEFGQNWLGMLTSGQSERAFQLTVDGARTPPPPEPGTPPPKTSPYQSFVDQSLIKSLTAAGANAEIRFDGTLSYQPQTYRNVIVRQQFEIRAASASAEGQPVQADLTVQRAQLPGEVFSRWLVTRYENATAAAGSTPKH